MKGKKASDSSGYKRMTIERLREFPGLQHLSDQEARQVIDSLEKLSLILFSYPAEIPKSIKQISFVDRFMVIALRQVSFVDPLRQ